MHIAEKKVIRAIILTAVIILIGSVVYHQIEGWSWLDSIYFSTTTVTTIGFGDLHPTDDLAKVFTIFYVLAGVSIVLYTVTTFGAWYVERYTGRRVFNLKDAAVLLKAKTEAHGKKTASKFKGKLDLGSKRTE